jgi:serine/threonine protein kinase
MPDQLARLQDALADRYTLQRELGRGGMATVYLAEDLKHHRQVALKVMRPELAATAERFLREITIAANLQHPNILAVYDSGEADGLLYYVMPYVEGPSVREQLRREGELPVREAVRILRDVADALATAHAKGVVHRDIKPENILLSGRHAHARCTSSRSGSAGRAERRAPFRGSWIPTRFPMRPAHGRSPTRGSRSARTFGPTRSVGGSRSPSRTVRPSPRAAR